MLGDFKKFRGRPGREVPEHPRPRHLDPGRPHAAGHPRHRRVPIIGGYGAGDTIRNPCRARVSPKLLALRNFGGARVSPEDFLFFRISTSPDRAGTPPERCAMKNSADHTNSHRNPSRLGLLYGIFSFLGVGAAGSGRGPLRYRCPGRVSLEKSGVASV